MNAGRNGATFSQRGFAVILDFATGREVHRLSGYMFGVHAVCYSPDSQRLAVGSAGAEAVTLWDLHTYERLLTLPAAAGVMHNLAFSGDGSVLGAQQATRALNGTVRFWRAPSFAEIEKAEGASAIRAGAGDGL